MVEIFGEDTMEIILCALKAYFMLNGTKRD